MNSVRSQHANAFDRFAMEPVFGNMKAPLFHCCLNVPGRFNLREAETSQIADREATEVKHPLSEPVQASGPKQPARPPDARNLTALSLIAAAGVRFACFFGESLVRRWLIALAESAQPMDRIDLGARSNPPKTSTSFRDRARSERLALEQHSSFEIDSNGLARCMSRQVAYEPTIRDGRSPFPQRLAAAVLGALAFALRAGSKVSGVLMAARGTATNFSSTHCEFPRQLSEQVAVAAHRASLYGAVRGRRGQAQKVSRAVASNLRNPGREDTRGRR